MHPARSHEPVMVLMPSPAFPIASQVAKTEPGENNDSLSCPGAANGEIDEKKRALPFPWKLYDMLEEAEAENNTDIVSWLPKGNAFRVHKPEEFLEQIMPRYFEQTKFKSFQRQLNLWGFQTTKKQYKKSLLPTELEKQMRGSFSYYHEHFRRGARSLCINLKRTKIKGVPRRGSRSARKAANGQPSNQAFPRLHQESGACHDVLLFDDATLSSVLPDFFFVPSPAEAHGNSSWEPNRRVVTPSTSMESSLFGLSGR